MLNNFKIAWRSLWRHKAYSLINIVGLTVGLTACLIVATVVVDELSYDKQWTKGTDIYRVLSESATVKGEEPIPVTFSGLGPSAKRELPEVASYCRMSVGKTRLELGGYKQGVPFKTLDAEPTIWDVLNLNTLKGDPQHFVTGYTNLILTRKVADNYFPGADPVGKVIMTVPDYGQPQKYLVTGVIDNLPQNSHLRADMITLSAHSDKDNRMPVANEGYTFEAQYLLLKSGTNTGAFTAKLNQWYKTNIAPKKVDYRFRLQPMHDIYLRSNFNGVQTVHGSMQNVYIFGGVAILLLLIACINFINLSISRVFTRAKETGVRKVLGAGSAQLIMRFLSESVLFFLISFGAAMCLYPALLKPVEAYLGHQLAINLFDAVFLISTALLVFTISIATGLYPAWYLSRPAPVTIMRDKIEVSFLFGLLKKSLVVGQFVISVTIILTTIIVHQQLSFMSSKDLGFDKNNLVNLDFMEWGTSGEAFKEKIKQLPGVAGASISGWYPTSGAGNSSMQVDAGGEKVNLYFIQADADLPSVLKLKVVKGRGLNAEDDARLLELDSLMGGTSQRTRDMTAQQPLLATAYTAKFLDLKLNSKASKFAGMPVGVLSDFYSESLRFKPKLTMIQPVKSPQFGVMLIRLKATGQAQTLNRINKAFAEFYPTKAFEHKWVSDLVDDQYKTEYKLQQLFSTFSLLIIFLACLGLFGLVTFTVEQRIKEIGIRKVLGAGLNDIVGLVSKDYLRLVFVAVVIASPIAWYAMNMWLQDFAYRIHIQWWVFLLAGGVAVLIAYITVAWQAIKAALVNPVKSLRSQ